jgi:hypothetical protein
LWMRVVRRTSRAFLRVLLLSPLGATVLEPHLESKRNKSTPE